MEMINSEASSENNEGTQDYCGSPGGPGGPGGYGPPGYGRDSLGGYDPPGYRGPGYGHGGSNCRWGCRRRHGYSACICCMHPNEIPEPMVHPSSPELIILYGSISEIKKPEFSIIILRNSIYCILREIMNYYWN
jgi:hypothetical protein